jgi:hypothetical protein
MMNESRLSFIHHSSFRIHRFIRLLLLDIAPVQPRAFAGAVARLEEEVDFGFARDHLDALRHVLFGGRPLFGIVEKRAYFGGRDGVELLTFL